MTSLGDGVMLAYCARPAVAAGVRIIERVRSSLAVSAHASVHLGTAIARDDDYFGGAVNLIARLLGAAGRDELVATRRVVERTADSQTCEPLGLHEIRGVSEPLEVSASRRQPAEFRRRVLILAGAALRKGESRNDEAEGACPPSVVVAATSWRRLTGARGADPVRLGHRS
jgi:class 3 adenylate cyclase